jgi:predicted glycosyltransferase
MSGSAGPRVLFYVQHLLGIGHLVRASRIADALIHDGFDVVVVQGGMPVPGFPGPHVKTVCLPALRSGGMDFSSLVDDRGETVTQKHLNTRRDRLLALARDWRPDILMLEAFPFGRRQVRFELIPLLETAAGMRPKPRIVSSIRDILQESRKASRDAEVVQLVNDFFDRVLVHGDPGFARLEETFAAAAAIAGRVRYTGLVAGAEPAPSRERYDVLVSAGGGAAGANLVRSAIQAAWSREQTGRKWCVITGPRREAGLPDVLDVAVRDGLIIEEFRPDFGGLLAAAELSISQAGYNTVSDVLSAGCRAVLSPFAGEGETEQTLRGAKLKSRKLAEVIPEVELNAPSLAAAVEQTLTLPKPSAHGLDLDGARNSARELRQLLAIKPWKAL